MPNFKSIKLLLLLFSFLIYFNNAFKNLLSNKIINAKIYRDLKVFNSLDVRDSVMKNLGGKVIVTGIGSAEEDEFMLSLLNQQNIWESVILVTPDLAATRKKFLTRTARYSGLLNILDFAESKLDSQEEIKKILEGANAWIAIDLPKTSIESYSKLAIDSGIKRFVVTTTLPNEDINQTVIPEFDAAISSFTTAGGAFTGIRHGEVIDGNEDNAYEIVNSTLPCLDNYVERGVLARVVTELLCIADSCNSQCGLSSSGSFAAAYLNVLRSSGLNRKQEVAKMFAGGLQKVARMTVTEYENKQKAQEELEAKKAKAKLEEEEEKRLEQQIKSEKRDSATSLAPLDDDESITPGWDEDQDEVITEEQKIVFRTEAILRNVWMEYDARMFTKQTTKLEFFGANQEKARALAIAEIEEEKKVKQAQMLEKKSQEQILDRFVDQNRKQYAKLLALERKEMQNQKDISDTWVKYIYLLLEITMHHCKENNILFHNEDQFSQTLLLRKMANELRSLCNLPSYDVVYDPLDASAIVSNLASGESSVLKSSILGATFDIPLSDVDQVLPSLNSKYGKLLKSIPALRGASQIIELAIETLKKELPPPPPTVAELRKSESSAKQKAVSDGRLDAIRNRGKPSIEEGPVGKL